MRDHVDNEWQNHLKEYISRERHAIQVDISYLDTLASLVGCLVRSH